MIEKQAQLTYIEGYLAGYLQKEAVDTPASVLNARLRAKSQQKLTLPVDPVELKQGPQETIGNPNYSGPGMDFLSDQQLMTKTKVPDVQKPATTAREVAATQIKKLPAPQKEWDYSWMGFNR